MSYSTTSARMSLLLRIFPGLSGGASGKEPANADFRDMGLIPGSGRSSGGGKGYPLPYSCLENSMDCLGHGGHKESDTSEGLHSLHSAYKLNKQGDNIQA